MKQTQWTIAALVLAVMVFGLTFAVNYLGGTANTPTPDDGALKPALELEFPLGKVYPDDEARLEQEENVAGHQDFWFVNRNAEPVTMGLDRTSCKCSEVEAFLLPDDRVAEANRLLAGQLPGPGVGYVSDALASLVRPPVLAALTHGLKGAKLKGQVDKFQVPAGAVGLVRLHWVGERPGRQAALEAKIWMDNPMTGKTATLAVHVAVHEAVRVKLDTNDPAVLTDEDLQKGATRTIYAWSSTRESFDLEARLARAAESPAADPVEVSKPEALTEAELRELFVANNAAPSADLAGRVLSGYRVKVTLRAVSPDGKTPFPVGPFSRRVLLSSRDAGVSDRAVAIAGRVEGVVEISGAAVEAGGVNFSTFRRAAGKKETVILQSDRTGLKLEVDRERTAKFLTASVRLDTRRKGEEGQRWQLVIEVRPGQARGLFPRDEESYKDAAVYLKATEPGKPPRPVRIAVRGTAEES